MSSTPLKKKMPRDMPSLLKYQHSSYHQFHQSKANVRLHLWAVPLFQLGNIMLLVSPFLLFGSASTVVVIGVGVGGIFLSAMSMLAQKRGHAMELNPPEPFEGPLNVVQRIFGEQWITFPRFVLSGGWRIAFEDMKSSRS